MANCIPISIVYFEKSEHSNLQSGLRRKKVVFSWSAFGNVPGFYCRMAQGENFVTSCQAINIQNGTECQNVVQNLVEVKTTLWCFFFRNLQSTRIYLDRLATKGRCLDLPYVFVCIFRFDIVAQNFLLCLFTLPSDQTINLIRAYFIESNFNEFNITNYHAVFYQQQQYLKSYTYMKCAKRHKQNLTMPLFWSSYVTLDFVYSHRYRTIKILGFNWFSRTNFSKRLAQASKYSRKTSLTKLKLDCFRSR